MSTMFPDDDTGRMLLLTIQSEIANSCYKSNSKYAVSIMNDYEIEKFKNKKRNQRVSTNC